MIDSIDSIVDLSQYKFDQAEKDLRLKLVDFSHRPHIQAQIGEAFYVWKNNPELLLENINEEDIDDLTFVKFFDWFIYDFKLLDDGKRVIERFYEEEGKDLSEVEKNILNDWVGGVHSFFEVEEVFPKEGCRVRDIFTGDVFQVKDSASSEQVVTSDVISGRPLKTGNNYYFSGVIVIHSPVLKPTIIDFFNREFKEYKKTFGRKRTPRDYLRDWGFLIGSYVEDVLNHPRFLTPEGDELVAASATYGLKNYKKALKTLREIKSLQEVEGGTDELRMFSWVRGDKNKVFGAVEVEKDKLTIECYSLSHFSKAKGLIEKKLRGLISHKEDNIRHLESFTDKKNRESKKTVDPSLKTKGGSEVEGIFDEYYDNWIDTPLKPLQGKTPREALETKGGRERLSSILDELEDLYEHAKERGEPYYNVKKLRKNLGLSE